MNSSSGSWFGGKAGRPTSGRRKRAAQIGCERLEGRTLFSDLTVLQNVAATPVAGTTTVNVSGSVIFSQYDWTQVTVDWGDAMPASTTSWDRQKKLPHDAVGPFLRNGREYFILTDDRDWYGARTTATAPDGMGAQLVTINDADENNFIKGIMSGRTSSAWIGAYAERINLVFTTRWTWKWNSGEAFTFSRWSAGEPNHYAGEDKAHIRGDGTWNDGRSYWTQDAIVEATTRTQGWNFSHQYASPGQYTVTVTGRDEDGTVKKQTLPVTVSGALTESPVIKDPKITAPPSAAVGETVGLIGSAAGESLSYAWTVSKNGVGGFAEGAGANFFSFEPNGVGTYVATMTVRSPGQPYDSNGNPSDLEATGARASVSHTLQVAGVAPAVVARHLFYNRSAWDGNSPAANAADDGAIAPDKQALLPGGRATFANYSSYSRGINGVMVDVDGLANAQALTAADFRFNSGTDAGGLFAAIAPAPASVTVRPGAGVGGSDRVTLTWADNAVQRRWLQVTMLPTANTGIAAPDTFYFGSAPGETGDTPSTAARVTGTDFVVTRSKVHRPTPLNSRWDFDRDRRVTSTDLAIVRRNFGAALPLVQVAAPRSPENARTVAELADALGHSPLAMFEWVYNNYEYQLYPGLMKGPLATLETRAGNDWDQAALLIDLLKEAGVTARFAFGKARLDPATIEKWLGVKQSARSVYAELFTKAALRPDLSNLDQPVIDHVWVEADLPEGKVWMDPSLKFKDFQPGVAGLAQSGKVPFDRDEYLSKVQTSPLTGAEQSPLEWYRDKVAAWLKTNAPDTSPADAGFTGRILQSRFFGFAPPPVPVEGMPTTHAPADEGLAAWRHTVEISIVDANDTAVLEKQTLVVPRDGLKRLTVNYKAVAGGVAPELRLDGLVLHTGTAVANGSPQKLIIRPNAPGGLNTPDQVFTFQAGTASSGSQHLAIALDGLQYSDRRLAALAAAVTDAQVASYNRQAFEDDLRLGGLRHLTAAKYLYEVNRQQWEAADLLHTIPLHPSVVAAVVSSNGKSTDGWNITGQSGYPLGQFPVTPANLMLGRQGDTGFFNISSTGDAQAAVAARHLNALAASQAQASTVAELTGQRQVVSGAKYFQLVAGLTFDYPAPNGKQSVVVHTVDKATWDKWTAATSPTAGHPVVLLFRSHHAAAQAEISRQFSQNPATTIDIPLVRSFHEPTYGYTVYEPAPNAPLPVEWGAPTTLVGWRENNRGHTLYHLAGAVDQGQVAVGGAGLIAPNSPAAPLTPSGNPDGLQTYTPWRVNVANGNVAQEATDVSLPATGMPLAFARHYDTQAVADHGMGVGWTFSYADRLTSGPEGALVWTNSRGHRYSFAPDGADKFKTPAGLHGTLTAAAHGGHVFRDRSGTVHTFDSAGRLKSVRDRNVNGHDVSYDSSGRLSNVTDTNDTSRTLTFTWADGRISSVRDFTGRTWTYAYHNWTDAGGNARALLASVTAMADAVTPAAVTKYDYYTDVGRGGLLKQVTDPDGEKTSYTYYANGRSFQVTAPDGGVTTALYDAAAGRSTFVDARGHATTYFVDLRTGYQRGVLRPDGSLEAQEWDLERGLVASRTDAFGRTTRYEYDGHGNVTKTTDRLDGVTTAEYDDPFGNITSTTDSNGHRTVLRYDNNGNLTSATDPLGNVTTMTYFPNGLLRTRTTPRGNETAAAGDYTTSYTYNPAGQLLSETTDLPSTVTQAYDLRGNRTSTTDARGNTTTFTYDLAGRLLITRDALGGVTTNVYSAEGDLLSTTDPLGRVSTFAYDATDRPLRISAADHTAEAMLYDAAGNVLANADGLGRETRHAYDARGQQVQTLHPDSGVTRQAYDSGGRAVMSFDAMGNATSFVYDAEGRQTKVIDALGGETTKSYDGVGNLKSVTDALGRITRYGYDAMNRQTSIDLVDGATSARQSTGDFDANGHLESVTDARGFATSYEYDVLGRRTAVVDARGNRVTTVYDAAGNVTKVTDARGYSSGYAYDALNRVTTASDALGTSTTSNYDAVGNVTKVVDPLGRATTYVYDAVNRHVGELDALGRRTGTGYDAAGQVVRTTDARGYSTSYAYDAVGRQAAVTDAAGNVTRKTHDLNGNLLSQTDRNGNATRYAYDALNRRVEVIDALGRRMTSAYDAVGNLVFVSDARGNGTGYEYDVLNRRTAVTDALGRPDPTSGKPHAPGHTTWTSYDANGNAVSVTDALNRTTTYAYDELNRRTRVTDARGGTTATEYDGVGNVIGVTDALMRETEYGYDAANRRISVTDPRGSTTGTTYDAVGNVLSVTDPLANRTAYAYDVVNRRTSVTDAMGHTAVTTYDENDNITKVTDALARTTSYAYDALNRRTSVTDALSRNTFTAYDPEGNVVSVKDPRGNITGYEYDALNRRTAVTDALGEPDLETGKASVAGRSTVTVYDEVGNVVSVRDALGNVTGYQYDELNRRSKVFEARGLPDPQTGQPSAPPYDKFETRITYDAVGNVIKVSDPLAHDILYAYDELNRRTSATDALKGITSTKYDAVGNVVEITDPALNATTFRYDESNRLTLEINALGGARSYTYDAVGNLTRQSDRNGRARTFTYDRANRRTAERWLDADDNPVRVMTFTLDAAGQITNVSDGESAYSYKYDLNGRPLTVSNAGTLGSPLVVLTYAYDEAGNRVRVNEQVNGTARAATVSSFDALNRAESVSQSGGGSVEKEAEFHYDAAGRLTTVYRRQAGTSVAESGMSYDEAGHLEFLYHTNVHSGLYTAHNLTYDAAGRVTHQGSADGDSTYTYDDTNQLTTAEHSHQNSEAYAYDANGNRIGGGHTTRKNNRLESDGIYGYQYDDEGNRTKRTELATGRSDEYTWDHRNRLTRVTSRNGTGAVTQVARYTYDAYDRRIAKAVDPDGPGPDPAAVERYVWDGQNIALQFDSADNLTHRYFEGPGIDQHLAVEQMSGGSSGVLWMLPDHQGTVRDVVSSTGTVLNHITYDSFGNISAQTDPAVKTIWGYTGRQLDGETGLMYYRARYYDPRAGRFVSEDPIGFRAGDANLSRYVGNAPVIRTDPSGLWFLNDGSGFFNTMGKHVSNAATWVWNGIKYIGEAAVNAAKAAAELAAKAAQAAAKAVAAAASWTANAVADAVSWTANAVGDAASWTVNAVGDAASWYVNAIADAASWTANAVADGASFVWNNPIARQIAMSVVLGVATGGLGALFAGSLSSLTVGAVGNMALQAGIRSAGTVALQQVLKNSKVGRAISPFAGAIVGATGGVIGGQGVGEIAASAGKSVTRQVATTETTTLLAKANPNLAKAFNTGLQIYDFADGVRQSANGYRAERERAARMQRSLDGVAEQVEFDEAVERLRSHRRQSADEDAALDAELTAISGRQRERRGGNPGEVYGPPAPSPSSTSGSPHLIPGFQASWTVTVPGTSYAFGGSLGAGVGPDGLVFQAQWTEGQVYRGPGYIGGGFSPNLTIGAAPRSGWEYGTYTEVSAGMGTSLSQSWTVADDASAMQYSADVPRVGGGVGVGAASIRGEYRSGTLVLPWR